MKTKTLCAAIGVFVLSSISTPGQNSKSILESAMKAMGDAKTIQFSGTGHMAALGQAYSPDAEWPETDINTYTRTIDYDQHASKEELTRVEKTPSIRGGGAPFAGEQKQVNFVSGQYSWAQPGNAPQPQVAAAKERQLQIWLTPLGFVKAAMENNATAKKGKGGTIVSFTKDSQKFEGTIDSHNLVTRTETWLPSPVLGDMAVETLYSDYKDFNGVKFPRMIVQNQGGHPVLDLNITAVQSNVGLDLTVPDAVRSASMPPLKVESQKMADGVWFIAGGTHNSVLVEYPNYLVMVEGPLNEARSLAVIAEAQRLVPNKPIKYLINTHHHFDHSGGIRTYVAEGATVITAEVNIPFYQTTFKNPRTMDPDKLAQNPRKATFIAVKDKYVLTDGGRTVEVYRRHGAQHNAGIMVVYLPKEKILVEADDFTPAPPNAPATSPRSHAATVNLYEDLQQMKLDVDTIAPLHGTIAHMADLQKMAGNS